VINLFTTYYRDKNVERDCENRDALFANIANRRIDGVWIMSEVEPPYKDIWSPIPHRPTFQDFFNKANEVVEIWKDETVYSIICNTDIYFKDLDLSQLGENECWALTRWDIQESGRARFLNRPDSQDAWIFKGKIKKGNYNFCNGIMGCDNRLAHELEVAGYKVRNVSLDVKAYHLHLTGVRNYKETDKKVPPPYKTLWPEFIDPEKNMK